jgi:tetratricopeptide (TPR) repeat protein
MVRRRTAALLRAGQPETAREAIQRLAAAGDASDLHLLFQAERDLGDLDAAESTARRIVAAEPDGVRGVHALAQILDQRRDFAGEIALLEPAIARGRQGRLSSRQLGVLLTQLGFAHQKLGQHDQAIEAFEQLRAVAPSDPSGAAYLVQAYLADGRTEEAVELAEGARQRFQDDPAILFQLAAILEQSGQDAEAERHFRDLLVLDPLNHQALNYLGYMLAEQDRSLEEAVALITRALEHDPQNPFYLDSLGWAHFKLGQLALAERYLRLAARALTTSSVVQEHLGDVLFHLDRIDEAIAAWQLALEGDGQSVERAAIAAKIRKARESGQRP